MPLGDPTLIVNQAIGSESFGKKSSSIALQRENTFGYQWNEN